LFCNEGLVFDELIIPERLFEINHSFNPLMSDVYQQIKEYVLNSKESSANSTINRIFFSRINFEKKIGNGRVSLGISREIESLFQNSGFKIVYPEQLSFQRQVELASNVEYLAGMEGSALHLSLFMRKGTTCISINGFRSNVNVTLCNDVQQVNDIQLQLNIDHIKSYLKRIS